MHRRLFSLGMASSLATAALGAIAQTDPLPRTSAAEDALARIEAASGGRLGVCMLDTGSGRSVGHRAAERFAMCSTFKFLAAAFVLRRVDDGLEDLARAVSIPAPGELVPYAPVTAPNAGRTMTVAQLCEAAVTVSDNPAANLLLASFGGPAGLTGFARSLGDGKTRLDRIEPLLNEATPGDERDTTTPASMLAIMQKTMVGDALSPASRDQLNAWMVAATTGARQLRAGLPAGWRIGDKTGSGGHGTGNDIAVVWPRRPDGSETAPWLVTAYLTQTTMAVEQRQATLARVGALASRLIGTAGSIG